MQPESSPEQVPHSHCLQLEVADIFRAHGKQYREDHPLSIEHLHVMRDIEQCRTAALGGHVDVCENNCGCASRALLDCALNWKRLGAHIGFTAVLHTGNQDLSFHPHLHIIATGGS